MTTFIFRNYYDVYASTLEKDEEVSEPEEVAPVDAEATPNTVTIPTDNHVHFSVVSAAELLLADTEGGGDPSKRFDDADNDANSCYYSASASHTDNYCSTDEHEHHVGTRQQVLNSKNNSSKQKPTAITSNSGCLVGKRPAALTERLLSSDSGADISENHLLDKMRWPAEHHHQPHNNGTLAEGSAEDDEDGQLLPAATTGNAEELSEQPQSSTSTTSSLSSPFHHVVGHERNHSLPNVLCPDALANEWETYWNRHGEQLIWASWIEKYSDYIDPAAFKENPSENVTEKNKITSDDEGSFDLQHNNYCCCSTANTLRERNDIFTFDEEEPPASSSQPLLPPLPNSSATEIVVSSCCSSGGDGGQLVPEDPWTSTFSSHRNRPSVDDRLLLQSPRCDSVNSSVPRGGGGGATDSMTNVTRMTLSSCEFCSSKVTSESSQNNNNLDNSNNNNNSTESSLMTKSSHSDEDDEVGDPLFTYSSQFYDAIDSGHAAGKLDPRAPPTAAQVTGELEAEDALDVDQHWQVLWEKHFQEQYARHYKDFTADQRRAMEGRVQVLSGSLKAEACFERRRGTGEKQEEDYEPAVSGAQQRRRSRSVKRRRREGGGNGINASLPKLVANLKIKNELEGGDCGPVDGDGEQGEAKGTEKEEEEAAGESNLMASLGLPQSFGSQKATRSSRSNNNNNDGDGDEDEDRPQRPKGTALKRSHESDSEEANRDRIKDAFQLMGFAYENTGASGGDEVAAMTAGEVVYRKKHIRLHNRALKMKIQTRPRLHIRFDEEGNAIEESSADAAEMLVVDGEVLPVDGGGGNAVVADPVLLHSSSDDDSGGGGGGVHQQRTGVMAAAVSSAAAVGQWAVATATASQQQLQRSVEAVPEEVGSELEEEEEEKQQQGKEQQQQPKKKRKRKGKITALLPPEIANDKTLMKYWYKRFSLFQMFDMGIRMDRGEWILFL